MRYEDASGAFQASGPVANDDSDTLTGGQRGPATGNLITGEGTQYGAAGADSAAGAHITSIAGKGGEDSNFAGGKLSIAGEHGHLSVDAKGNYSYMANKGAPENVRDRFTYTLADNQGNSDTAALIVEIGKTPVVLKADAQQIVPGPDGVVTLPPGVDLSDIMVVGRNLVVNMPDGTQLIIVDGAIFIPQLVLGGVEVPATNVATLLIGQEPQPAAGELPPSSGGNFALPPPPLDPGVPLGDLIPPTEYDYTPPEPQEVLEELDDEPEITIQPDGQPESINAVDSVDEAGLPERNEGEPEGSGEEAAAGANGDTSETTGGVIHINSDDEPNTVAINGVVVTAVGQEIEGEFGTLTITSISDTEIGYSYTLDDNTSGDATHDDFSVVLTDADGDTAEATLTINIIDDEPTARNDTDAVVKGDTSTDGNVMSGVGTTSAPGGVDTVGADDSEVTGVHAGTSGSFSSVPDGGITIVGQFGDLTIFPDGSYTYELHAEVGNGGTDVFTYQLTDGDGDTDTATLTITVPPDLKPSLDAPNVGEAGTVVDEAGLPARPGEPEGTGEEAAPGANGDDSETTTGTINFTPGDTPATITINGVAVTGVVGQTFAGDYGTLTITGFNANGTINYSYTLNDNVDHDTDATPFEEFDVEITDADGDTASDTLRIDIVDDAPIANNDTDSVTEDVDLVANGNVLTGVGSDGNPAGDDLVGADDSIVTLVDGLNPGVGQAVATPGGVAIVGQYGTLVIHSDGSYTYTLDNTNPAVQALSDGDTLQEQFQYTILDGDGDTDTAILTITINGDNDVPTVDAPNIGEAGTVVDEAGLPPRGSEPPGTGEVADGNPNNESDDSETTAGVINFTGGDGATTITINGVVVTGVVGQTFAGDYGTLTITGFNPNGTINYSYTLEDNVDHDSDATPFEEFDIVVSDSDGDPSDDATDTLRIDIINDAPIARDDTDSVVEGDSTTGNVITGTGTTSGAAGADTPGADNFAPSAVVGVVAGDDDAVDTNSPATVGAQIAGTYGTLTLNADGSYTYEADPNTNPPPGAVDEFVYTVIDNDGNMDSAVLTISVIDDLQPTVDAPNTGEDGTVVDEAGLPPRPGEPGGTGEVADGNPNNESDDSEVTSGVVNFTTGDAPATVTINGVVVTGAGQTFAGDYGTLTITGFNPNGSINYTYVLEDNVDHDSDATPFETFTIEVTDDDGDSASDDLIIDIINDAPIARDDTDSVVEGASTNGNVITGTGTTSGVAGADTPGADNFAASAVVGVVVGDDDAVDTNSPATVGAQIAGTYGTLTLNADGSYTYEADPNTNPPPGAVDEFVYTVIDNDGNMDSAVLTISVIDDLVPDVPENTIVGLDDDALAGGNPGTPAVNDDPDSSNTSGSVAAVGGDLPISYELLDTGEPGGFDYVLQGNGDLWVMQGTTHVLTITLDQSGNYTVTQVNPIVHVAGSLENNQSFTITFRATDVDGDFDDGTLSISVDDDTPIANDDTDSIASGQFGPATGNVITGVGTIEGAANADSDGADGGGAVVGVVAGDTNTNLNSPATVGVVVQGAYGDLTLNADGSYSYTRDAGTPGGVSDVFTYTFIDGDGDMVNATLTINIGNSTPDVPENTNVGLDDDALTGGNPGTPAVNDDPDATNTSGSVASVGGDGPITYALTETGAPLGFTYDLQPNGDLHVLQGTTHVLTITLDQSGNYTVTQVNPIDHAAGNLENNQSFTVTFSATDVDNDVDEGTLTINVDDDSPINFTPVGLTDKTGATATLLDDALENDGNANVIRFLNDANANPANGENFIGADGFGNLVFTATGHVNGEALEDNLGTPLTSGGDPIFLFGYGTDTLTATTSADNSDPSAVVFTVTLSEGTGNGSGSTYEVEFFQTIDDGSGFVFDDFSGAPAGQNQWIGLDADIDPDTGSPFDINDPADPNANSEDLLITPTNVGGTINTSATDIGNANQWIDEGEGIRLDFVIDVRRDGANDEKDAQGYTFDGHYNITDAQFTVMQTQGGGLASIRIRAVSDVDTGNIKTLGGSTVPIDLASIDVFDADGGGEIEIIDMGDGTFVITGLEANDTVSFEAVGDAPFNAVEISNAALVLDPSTPAPGDTFGGADFAVGVFGFNSETQGDPIDMSFDVTASDDDGDTATGTIDISLVPVSSSAALPPDPQSFAATSEEGSSLLVSNDNGKSNGHANGKNPGDTGIMAGIVAAAGLGSSAAAHQGNAHDGHGQNSELTIYTAETIEHMSIGGDSDDSAVSMMAPEPSAAQASATASSSSSADSSSSNTLDSSPAPAAAEASSHASSGDQGPADAAADAAPAAPAVAMASAEALQAAGVDGAEDGSVAQVVADALGEGNAPTLDGVLANLPGGLGELAAIAHMASPDGKAVSGWDMAGHGAIGAGHDMLFKVDVAMHHQDAVQPAVNG